MNKESTNTSPIPRIRGIKQAAAELKQADPNTPIKEKTLRRLVLSGSIPSIRIGGRYYINMDVLNEYLTNGIELVPEPQDYGVIRAIKEA